MTRYLTIVSLTIIAMFAVGACGEREIVKGIQVETLCPSECR